MYIEVDSSQQMQSMMKCLVNQTLLSKDDWMKAYANDKDTNYILARLKDSTAWDENEIRKVHKGYWQAL